MTEPYYSDELVTLYHGDCQEVMRHLQDTDSGFDLVFTSPPYNLGVSAGGGFGPGGKWTGGALAHGYTDHDDAMPMDAYEGWQQEVLHDCWVCLSEQGAIFYNHKPRVQAKTLWTPLRLNPGLPLRQIITWSRSGGVNFAPTHYLPTYEWIMVLAKPGWRLKSKGASGVGDVWSVPQESNSTHPAPFPIGLPERAIESAGPSSVLDPALRK